MVSISSVLAQSPKKFDFSSPLDIQLILSGTFGELRTNHFHTGLDIKTKGRIGFDVKSIDDGYVSRINVSPFGYGKAIYITHPNGYTSVYAHLDSFSPEIEKLVKKEQYKKERFTITIYPKENKIRVIKNQIIGKTGNSGGSAGPHLHFEIRDTKTAKPQNPFNFGYKIKDSRKPTIRNAYVYKFDKKDGNIISLEKIVIDNEKVDTVFVPAGWIGLGIDTYDKLDYANNKNGVYSVKLSIDKNEYFKYKMDSLDFTEQRYINSFIDYAYFKENRKRIQKLFLDPGNKLSIYNFNKNDGYLEIEEGKILDLEMVVEDFKGNKTTANIVIKGSAPIKTVSNESKVVLDYSKDNLFETYNFKIKIPKGALYNNAGFDYSYRDSIYCIGDPNIPLQKSCSIELKIDNLNDSLADKMVIVSISDKGNESFVGGKIKDGYIYTRTRSFGKYKISYDTLAPTVTAINIKEGKWMSKDKFLKVKIEDDLSGIKKYRGEIDGHWIRMDYDAKRRTLKYNFDDLKLKGEKHTFTLEVKDNVGNLTKYRVLFYRKN
jgi:hypothetical protein